MRPDWLDQKLAEVKRREADTERAKRIEEQHLREERLATQRQWEREQAAMYVEQQRLDPVNQKAEQLKPEVRRLLNKIRKTQQENFSIIRRVFDQLGIRELLLDVQAAELPSFEFFETEVPPDPGPVQEIEVDYEAKAHAYRLLIGESKDYFSGHSTSAYATQGDVVGLKREGWRYHNSVLDSSNQPRMGVLCGLARIKRYKQAYSRTTHIGGGLSYQGENRGGGYSSTVSGYEDRYRMTAFTIGISQFKDMPEPHLFFELIPEISAEYDPKARQLDPSDSLSHMKGYGFLYNPLDIIHGKAHGDDKRFGIIGFVDGIDKSREAVQLAIANIVYNLPQDVRSVERPSLLSRLGGRIFNGS